MAKKIGFYAVFMFAINSITCQHSAFIGDGVINVQVSESSVKQPGHILFRVKFSENHDLISTNQILVEFAALFRHDYDMFNLNVVSLEVSNAVTLSVGTYSFDIAIKTNSTDLVYGSAIVDVTESASEKVSDLDVCTSREPCLNGATCITTQQHGSFHYHCLCAEGYGGVHCSNSTSVSNPGAMGSAGRTLVAVAVASGVGGVLLAAVCLLLVLLTAVVLGAKRRMRHFRVKGSKMSSISLHQQTRNC